MLSKPHGSWDLPITKISLDSHNALQYSLQSFPDYETQYRESFNVDRWGNVYGLVTAFPRTIDPQDSHRPDHLIAKFKDDGTVDSTVVLSNPSAGRLDPTSFDVFSDGSFLVTGILVASSEGSQKALRPFTGIFDRSGRLIRELTLPNDVGPDSSAGQPETGKASSSKAWGLEIGQGAMISGPDGNVYVLRAAAPPQLYGISPGGEIVHQVKIPLPAEDLSLLELSFVDSNTLFAEFSPVASKPDVKADFGTRIVIGLVDLSTGELKVAYRMPTGMSNLLPGCPTARNEFSFIGTGKNGKLEVLEFSDR